MRETPPEVKHLTFCLQVQDITLKLFLQKELPAELRIFAFTTLLESKPPMALVSTITAHLLEEKDLQVVGFAYSYLRSFARSSTPDNTFLWVQ